MILSHQKTAIFAIASLVSLAGCAGGPIPGPDKQAAGGLSGAIAGAGAGAVTGFQVGAGVGPAAWAGAGLGAVAGGVQGAVQDSQEQQMLDTADKLHDQRARAVAQEILSDHVQRRMALHPARDLYPADLFFYGDQADLRPAAEGVVKELALLNKQRLPYSRLVVIAYVKAANPESAFAKRLAERRARALGDGFVRYGIEPRRIETRGVIVNAPLLIDPADRPTRYNQAIELSMVDK